MLKPDERTQLALQQIKKGCSLPVEVQRQRRFWVSFRLSHRCHVTTYCRPGIEPSKTWRVFSPEGGDGYYGATFEEAWANSGEGKLC